MEIIIKIKKADIYDEVALLSGYVGAKTIADTGLSYDRVAVTDDDREMLEQFWRETTATITNEYRRLLKEVTLPDSSQQVDMNEVYTLTLELPSNFNGKLKETIENSLRSYCINSIAAKWFAITNKGEAEFYMAEAQNNALTAKSKMFHRTKPLRTNPMDL